MAKNTTKKLINELERVFGVLIYESPVKAAERVVTELQQEGPIWTGKYANSWQIEAAGTRRAGNAQPVKSPKMTPKKIKQAQKRGFIEWEISNLARSAPYAEDKKLGRFRRGKAGSKVIGNEPRTALGQSKFQQSGSGRKGLTKRGDTGGGTPGILSGKTAELDWLPKTLKGGELKGKLRLEFKKGKSR